MAMSRTCGRSWSRWAFLPVVGYGQAGTVELVGALRMKVTSQKVGGLCDGCLRRSFPLLQRHRKRLAVRLPWRHSRVDDLTLLFLASCAVTGRRSNSFRCFYYRQQPLWSYCSHWTNIRGEQTRPRRRANYPFLRRLRANALCSRPDVTAKVFLCCCKALIHYILDLVSPDCSPEPILILLQTQKHHADRCLLHHLLGR